MKRLLVLKFTGVIGLTEATQAGAASTSSTAVSVPTTGAGQVVLQRQTFTKIMVPSYSVRGQGIYSNYWDNNSSFYNSGGTRTAGGNAYAGMLYPRFISDAYGATSVATSDFNPAGIRVGNEVQGKDVAAD